MNDLKPLKQLVEEITLSETKCVQIMQRLLVKENVHLHNDVLEKLISVLERWSFVAPVELLKELESFQDGKT